MTGETIIRGSTLIAIAFAGTIALSCVARGITTFTTPNASLTTYSLFSAGTKVLSPPAGQNVLVMAVCKDASSQGVAYVNLQRITGSSIVWEGQDANGNLVSGSSGTSGVTMAAITPGSGPTLQVSGPDKIQVHNAFGNLVHAGSVTMIW